MNVQVELTAKSASLVKKRRERLNQNAYWMLFRADGMAGAVYLVRMRSTI